MPLAAVEFGLVPRSREEKVICHVFDPRKNNNKVAAEMMSDVIGTRWMRRRKRERKGGRQELNKPE